ncbi:bifunctional 3-phenylpropionate/cinnamic acid dioxygenase ferredoxin subunit [Streptomonospora wellingtoniae]|uniref:Bifunctional 3-phenylpropionate/cinnamic acid dioxygenase ferredoxin subunit n=1 Tax=Streptomonospora wellingtoniae TaxID=3075544 RepID=A0ABU2KW71_9ACTN|nr:bifunctional 3-phenylpropionate/cinnamic acid dioxygenase ferredoxin subunit [Streptomonospora sp. DSM 45055]MDT0303373.1 bifunctional 3-phenylpropionate/cinnamic acid dioxygenase ferredoxin subunit [Streptomonospora sp. DSM 45055]
MIYACHLNDLPQGESLRVMAYVPIAVFNADGEIYAVDDTCTHQNASLSEGWLEGCHIECPLHEAAFDLRTGQPSCLPAKRPVRTYDVTVAEDGGVYVHAAAVEPAVAPAAERIAEGAV